MYRFRCHKYKKIIDIPSYIYTIICLLILLLIFYSPTIIYASDSVRSEKRIALVIGNSSYRNVPVLPNPKNDAAGINQALKHLNFDVDFQINLTKQEMDNALRRFEDKLDGASVALFYYAGHGLQVAGTNFLIPIDAALEKERDLHYEAIDLSLVLSEMEASQRVNLIFLDACRDNPFSKKLMRGIGSSRAVSIGRGLAPMNASAGTLISYATKDGEVAADGTQDHSPYTQALLNQIEQPGVEISQMLRRVRMEVMTITEKKQTPWEYGSLIGDFYFNASSTAQPTYQSPTHQTNTEALYWQSIMNENTPDVFKIYLDKYPNGEFADLAKRKIISLTKGTETLSEAERGQLSSSSYSPDPQRSSHESANIQKSLNISPQKNNIVMIVPFENLSHSNTVVDITRTFRFYGQEKVMVIKADQYSEASRSILEDIVATFPNVGIVEHQNIDNLYVESSYPFINNKVVNTDFLIKVGKHLGANIIAAGTIVSINENSTTFNGYGIQTRKKTCEATLRLRLIDIQSKQIIFSKTVEGKHDQMMTNSGGIQNSNQVFLAIRNGLDRFREDKELMNIFHLN